MPELERYVVDDAVRRALEEDIGCGDVTTRTVVPEGATAVANLVARAHGILAGIALARRTFEILDPGIIFEVGLRDGAKMKDGSIIATIRGAASTILTGERTALNFLQHLSGIATHAAQIALLVADSKTRILDTRKTVPGLRTLAKYACRVGGVGNHRMGLFDGVLIKNNHLKFASPSEAVRRARALAPSTNTIEIEVETLEQLRDALTAQPDIIMLDNMDLETTRQAIEIIAGRARIEVSGSVTPDRLEKLASLGVDYVSMGLLTHSSTAIDISLRVLEVHTGR